MYVFLDFFLGDAKLLTEKHKIDFSIQTLLQKVAEESRIEGEEEERKKEEEEAEKRNN